MNRWLAAILLALLPVILLPFTGQALAAVTVTPASGGSAISADTTGGAYTALAGPVLAEGSRGSIGTGTIILTVPTGFVFSTALNSVSAAVTCTGSNGNLLVLASGVVTPTTTTVTIRVSTKSSVNRKCTITYAGIQARPVSGSPLANGVITKSGTSAYTVNPALGTNGYGRLTEVEGAASALAFSTQPGSTIAGCTASPSALAGPPTVQVEDQFGNPVGAGAQSISMAIGTNPAGGLLAGTTDVIASAGIAVFSALSIDNSGTGYTLVASSTGLTSATSAAFDITSDTVNGFVVEALGGGDIGSQTQGAAFNITVTAVDACLNAVTSYVSNVTISSSCTLSSGNGATPNFVAGVLASRSVTISATGTCTITATNGVTGTSNSFTVGQAGSGFDVVEVGAAPATRIFTRLSATAFSLDVLVLNSGGAVVSNFSGTVSVEIVDSSSGTCATMTRIALLPNLVFAGTGRLTITVLAAAVPDVWKNARFRIRSPAAAPTITSCSTDNFAIRPASIALSATDATWNSAGTGRALDNTIATGGNVHGAGLPFTLTVSPQPAAATNYNTTAFTVTAGYPSCIVPASCTIVAPVLGTFSAAGSGVQQSNTASYAEAGAINLQLQDDSFAAVDAGDGTPATCSNSAPIGKNICSTASLALGRFVPAQFVVTPQNSPAMQAYCGVAGNAFTYLGQKFRYKIGAEPQALITAQNAGGTITTNYNGTGTGHLTKAMLSQVYANLGTGTLDANLARFADTAMVLTMNSGPGVTGSGTTSVTISSNDRLLFTRNSAAPSAAFSAALRLTLSAADTSEAGPAGNPASIATTSASPFDGATHAGMTFVDTAGTLLPTAGNLGPFRYGRLRLGNAVGSELNSSINIPIKTEYWASNGFIAGTDTCTVLKADKTSLSMPGYRGTGSGTTLGSANMNVAGNAILTGGNVNVAGYLKLLKPNPAATGSVDLTVNLNVLSPGDDKTHLQGAWSGVATYTANPTARVRFGAYNSEVREIIFFRENY